MYGVIQVVTSTKEGDCQTILLCPLLDVIQILARPICIHWQVVAVCLLALFQQVQQLSVTLQA